MGATFIGSELSEVLAIMYSEEAGRANSVVNREITKQRF